MHIGLPLYAVGFYCGNVAIYDVRNPKDPMPVAKTSVSTGKHNDPVWKVQWIDSNSDHGESLVSISTDGRVTQWFLKKVGNENITMCRYLFSLMNYVVYIGSCYDLMPRSLST